jgi:hypothetical protein
MHKIKKKDQNDLAEGLGIWREPTEGDLPVATT